MMKIEKTSLTLILAIGLVFSAGFVHLMSWDRHSFAVVPLKFRSFIGLINKGQKKSLAQICFERMKYDCVEANYQDLAPIEKNGYLRLGRLQLQRGKYFEASDSFRLYFSNVKNSLPEHALAHHLYARALGAQGRVSEAIVQFENALRAKPKIRQVNVIHDYIQLLMKSNRYADARKVIEAIKKQDPHNPLAAELIKNEYKELYRRGTSVSKRGPASRS